MHCAIIDMLNIVLAQETCVSVDVIYRKSLKQKLTDLYIEGAHREPFCQVMDFQHFCNLQPLNFHSKVDFEL